VESIGRIGCLGDETMETFEVGPEILGAAM
jgi:hypothetical protein